MTSTLYTRRQALRLGALGAGAAALSAACGGGAAGGSGKEIGIAIGYGISYAPFTIIQAKRWLEGELPDRTISWKIISGGGTVRDALLSGKLHLGCSGLGPLLIGWDAGVPWKIVSSLNDMPLWLVAKDPRFKSLRDFRQGDQIAAVQPGSIQSVMLQKAAQQQLGDPHALDKNIATMAHPEALEALLGGQIAAAYTSPPFQFQAVEQGARKLVDSYDLFGKHGFNVVAATEQYAEQNPDVLTAVHKVIARANDFITRQPAEAAKILVDAEKGKITAEQYEKYLTYEGIEFTTTPHGLVKLAAFMKEIGVIKKAPSDWRDVVFDTVRNENGS
ncbi:ABC transporter substrate-binding protein [Actinomadura sp. NBRC 104425]|uniref:ABC transporter substrate-binding protein n=1 Tax=Actinomadura sp. NBRC 104425 TaxID=3032204 RepID=UPI0024A15875|nr:ABC transporter substrate-binding protein [Actinomadura sp. NBRC 104425]GLZ12736.1 ABC transporter substrate-binding protein [Actinomadura sp. NBRC 104425]